MAKKVKNQKSVGDLHECLKCGKMFPWHIVVDNVRRSCTGRRYCYDCSPFGRYNRRNLRRSPLANIPEKGERCCSKCNRCLPESEFQKSTRWCKYCANKAKTERLMKNKLETTAYGGGKCAICGYDTCTSSLEFHHLDPDKKDPKIHVDKRKGLSTEIKRELDKCILLCANCHHELHHRITLEKYNLLRLCGCSSSPFNEQKSADKSTGHQS